jgi:hypothetical protein
MKPSKPNQYHFSSIISILDSLPLISARHRTSQIDKKVKRTQDKHEKNNLCIEAKSTQANLEEKHGAKLSHYDALRAHSRGCGASKSNLTNHGITLIMRNLPSFAIEGQQSSR